MKRSFTPCEKHDLIGCVTCTWKPQLPQIVTVNGPVYDYQDQPVKCSFCGAEYERGDQVTYYQRRPVHVYCLTDRGEPVFHTYDNATTQHSRHDADKWEPSIWPTTADRGWEREDTE